MALEEPLPDLEEILASIGAGGSHVAAIEASRAQVAGLEALGLAVRQCLDLVYRCFWPELVILGRGVSHESTKYLQYLTPRGPLKVARFLNSAGIVGAALAAADSAMYWCVDFPSWATSD